LAGAEPQAAALERRLGSFERGRAEAVAWEQLKAGLASRIVTGWKRWKLRIGMKRKRLAPERGFAPSLTGSDNPSSPIQGNFPSYLGHSEQ
jgi:hypothetical protein